MLVSNFTYPNSACGSSSSSTAGANLPDNLSQAFRFSFLPRMHSQVTVKANSRKRSDATSSVSDGRILELLSRLGDDKYLIEPKVDKDGWTFTCKPKASQDYPCLTLRTDRLHKLEWIESLAEDEKFHVDFENKEEAQSKLPHPSSFQQHSKCPQKLLDACPTNPSRRRELKEVVPSQSDFSAASSAAYEYLRELAEAPITDENDFSALQKAQNILDKVLNNEKHKFGPGNVGKNIEETNYESLLRASAQRELAKNFVCVLFSVPSNQFAKGGEERAPEYVENAMKECWPVDFLKKLELREPNAVKAFNLTLPIAEAACSWMGGAFYCGELASTIVNAFDSELEEGEEIRRLTGTLHTHNEYVAANQKSFRVDGWIGRVPVFTEDAYNFPSA